jgi:hypothetical protein
MVTIMALSYCSGIARGQMGHEIEKSCLVMLEAASIGNGGLL